jgi:hypothetical protein
MKTLKYALECVGILITALLIADLTHTRSER